jgi:recombination protein RecA
MANVKKKDKEVKGRVSIQQMRDILNKKAGAVVAYNLEDANPTDVDEWIPTGSRWLDSIICKGKLSGIPMGKIVELAGLEAAGKSYMAAQIAAHAQQKGIDVIYFDSESAIASDFMEKVGCDLSTLLYVQARSVEFVLETIEEILANNQNKMLFIWDSIAFTPTETDVEGDFNPQSSMAVKPRILSKAFSKLIQPLANSGSTLLCLNQLKTNIAKTPQEALLSPYFTPGGKALAYAYSLRIWLTARKGKASFILNDAGFRIGNEVKAKIEKSRFGTQGRECTFKILWGGDEIAIQDEESWFEAVKNSDQIKQSGAWYTLIFDDGKEVKFQATKWLEMLKDQAFRDQILRLMDKEVIQKFDSREGNAKNFYNIDGEEEPDVDFEEE